MSIGVWEVMGLLVVVLILFGAGKLPNVMGDVAKGIKSFRKGMAEEDAVQIDNQADKPAKDVDAKTDSSKDT